MGLPTPNLFAGEHNFHSRLEWVSVQDMEKAVEVIVHLCQIWDEENRKVRKVSRIARGLRSRGFFLSQAREGVGHAGEPRVLVRVPRSVRKFVSVTGRPSTTPAGSAATGPIATPAVNDACDPNRSADPR